MYLVVFYEECVGYHFYDEQAKLFNDKNDAICYADKLNKQIALEELCAIEDLGDYYDIIFVPIWVKTIDK